MASMHACTQGGRHCAATVVWAAHQGEGAHVCPCWKALPVTTRERKRNLYKCWASMQMVQQHICVAAVLHVHSLRLCGDFQPPPLAHVPISDTFCVVWAASLVVDAPCCGRTRICIALLHLEVQLRSPVQSCCLGHISAAPLLPVAAVVHQSPSIAQCLGLTHYAVQLAAHTPVTVNHAAAR